jgi:hypothetical protein
LAGRTAVDTRRPRNAAKYGFGLGDEPRRPPSFREADDDDNNRPGTGDRWRGGQRLMRVIPTPTVFAARALPGGIPIVRQHLRAWTGLSHCALDPDATPGDPGLFGPGSATWEVVSQPAQALAGLRAALLQALSAPIVTATNATGAFANDFAGRVARTGAFVQRQNLGSLDEVYRSARKIRAMHRVVTGIGPNDVRYDASDPHQQAWVSMTLTDSFLVMVERYGSGPLSNRRANEFVAEQSTHGALLDPRVDLDEIFTDPDQRTALQEGRLPLPLIVEGELPTTVAGLRERMRTWTGELQITEHTRRLLDAAVRLTGLPAGQRAAIRPLVLATLATVPDGLHDLLAPHSNRLEEQVAAQAMQTPLALFSLLLGPSPALAVAHARVAAR